MDTRKALDFCLQNGTSLERYRVNFHFRAMRDNDRAVETLQKLELPGGGFPYNLGSGNPVCLSDTVSIFGTMVELDLLETPVADRTRNFLYSRQLPDGNWDEYAELNQYKMPQWDRPGDLLTQAWLTGEIVRQLAKDLKPDREKLRMGCVWLKENFDGEKMVGYKITSGIALAAFHLVNPKETEVIETLTPLVRRWTAEEEDPAFISWLLDCLVDFGITREDDTSKAALDKLEGLQKQDGSWGTADGNRWAVNTTINALRLLRWARRW
jgi:hypothetical protein